jgi:hypothetical protein
MRRRTSIAVALVTATFFLARPASAQLASAPPEASHPQVSGWAFTPTLVYSGSWDDNVLLHGQGDQTTGDFLTVVNPRGELEFNGRRGQFDLAYNGAFLLYRAFNTLNSYDQRAAISGQRMLTKHLTVFFRDNAALVPTTDAVEFVGVPFLRTGSRVNDLRGGIEVVLSKRTSVTAAYSAQWIKFDETDAFAQLLRGGHSQGGSATLRHQLSTRLTVLADYDIQHADVGPAADGFDIQNGTIGMEYRLTELTRISGAVGASRLGVSSLAPARTGPAWRAAITRQFKKAGLDLSYARSFVPSYGFGGTTQNEEATGRGRLPLSHRVYTQASLSWRRNEPLTLGDLKLTSWWFATGVGVGVTPWLRVEGFYNGSRQTIDRPGGILDRNQIGFQFVMAQPVRIH